MYFVNIFYEKNPRAILKLYLIGLFKIKFELISFLNINLIFFNNIYIITQQNKHLGYNDDSRKSEVYDSIDIS